MCERAVNSWISQSLLWRETNWDWIPCDYRVYDGDVSLMKVGKDETEILECQIIWYHQVTQHIEAKAGKFRDLELGLHYCDSNSAINTIIKDSSPIWDILLASKFSFFRMRLSFKRILNEKKSLEKLKMEAPELQLEIEWEQNGRELVVSSIILIYKKLASVFLSVSPSQWFLSRVKSIWGVWGLVGAGLARAEPLKLIFYSLANWSI